jgi:hypothetical protein
MFARHAHALAATPRRRNAVTAVEELDVDRQGVTLYNLPTVEEDCVHALV